MADSYLPPFLPTPPWSLEAEIGAFENLSIFDPNALYIVFSGSNDLTDALDNGLSHAAVVPVLLDGTNSAINAFRAAGAQTILVPNVPDLGLIPAYGGTPLAAQATALSHLYNAQLADLLTGIASVNIIGFDTFDWMQNVVNTPGDFGFVDVSSACFTGLIFLDPFASECANPGEYLFWDSQHPTAAANALLADKMIDTLQPVSVPEPPSLTLFAVMVLAYLSLYWSNWLDGTPPRGRESR